MKLTNNWKWTDWLILFFLYLYGFRFIRENDIVINGIPVGVIGLYFHNPCSGRKYPCLVYNLQKDICKTIMIQMKTQLFVTSFPLMNKNHKNP